MTTFPNPRRDAEAIEANLVIGSGPAGISVASALLDAGQRVTLLDVGHTCEPERVAVAHELADHEPEDWPADGIARLRGPTRWDPALPKRVFGSEFPYAREELPGAAQTGTRCLISFAQGGLSQVWGAATLPSRADDIADWPVRVDELQPHFEAVGKLLRIAAADDELSPLLPLYASSAAPPPLSTQAEAMLSRLTSNRAALRRGGVWFGRSRLALRTQDDERGTACRRCGLCLSGCPYGAIWNASDVLADLRTRGLSYHAGWIATRLAGGLDCATVMARHVDGGQSESFRGRRVFVGCGPLATVRLVADSVGLHGVALPVAYQPYFLAPMVGFTRTRDVERERLHTLAQLFLEIDDPAISPYLVHLQLYTFNDVMAARVAEVLPRVLVDAMLRPMLFGRMMAIQGYLHSKEGDPFELRCEPDATRGRSRLVLASSNQQRARRSLRRVARRLARLSPRLGAVPLLPMVHLGEPGEGNHVGGTFPMRTNPSRLETDRLGQLAQLPRVHLVDASVMPSLAATTFTYTMMTNAHRIATEVAALEIG